MQFMLGDIKKGTYSVSFTLHGDDIGKWEKFQGQIYPITWNENYETTFSAEAYTRGQTPYGNIFDTNCVKQGNTYTYTITLTEDIKNFGIELCGATTVDYTIYLDAFKFEKLPAITDVEIAGLAEGSTLKSGDINDLNAAVTFENNVEMGEPYTYEWEVQSKGESGGSALIIDGENGKKQLQCLKPGDIVLTLKVTSATGVYTDTLNLTIELGELSIETNMYADNILVAGDSYDFAPIPLIDDMTFTYKYKTEENSPEFDSSDIVEVKDGKLIAKKAGAVYLIVSSNIDGEPISKTLYITVKEYSGTVDESYEDAINPIKHGDFYDIERTNVIVKPELGEENQSGETGCGSVVKAVSISVASLILVIAALVIVVVCRRRKRTGK